MALPEATIIPYHVDDYDAADDDDGVEVEVHVDDRGRDHNQPYNDLKQGMVVSHR